MTEQEWLAATIPGPMLDSLGGKASDRKIQLFACGCVRQVWQWLTDKRSRRAIEVAEEFIDMPKGPNKRIFLHAEVMQAWDAAGAKFTVLLGSPLAWAKEYAKWTEEKATEHARRRDRRRAQADLLRDLVGNRFRTLPAIEPTWLARDDGRVSKLARSMYDERSFDRMPVLADALEDAGCSDSVILDHCRHGKAHARGCWVVDLLLGLE